MMTRFSNVISCMTRRHKSTHVASRLQRSDSSPDVSETHAPYFELTEDSSGCPEAPKMEACLNTFDLVSLGVGSCLGTGMYLTAGLVAATLAGPGGFLSFLVAGVASMLTGLCYAELAGLCPKSSGSAYMYAYVTVGELAAFVIGWGLMVEYVIGTAAGAVALSETLDSMSEGLISFYTKQAAHFMGLPKFDVLAALICALLTLLLASGAEMSAKVNNALNICNVTVLLFFFVACMVLGTPKNLVAGGFFPFGVTGVVGAIPTCYFAYIGFDTLAATGEEAKDPSRSIPRSILLSILFNCLAYVVVILALTFVRPFYLLHPETAMTDVFPEVDFTAGKYIVAIGAVSGEFAATFGSLFPLPRVLTAMASDGLIFKRLGKICPKRHTPVTATLISGFLAMVFAAFFDLGLLIELVLIGTLLAYVLVTFALLFIRYIQENSSSNSPQPLSETSFHKEPGADTASPGLTESCADICDPGVNDSSGYQRRPGTATKQPRMSRLPSSSFKKGLTFASVDKPSFNGEGSDSKRDVHAHKDSKSTAPVKKFNSKSSNSSESHLFPKLFRRKSSSEQKRIEYKTLSESSEEEEEFSAEIARSSKASYSSFDGPSSPNYDHEEAQDTPPSSIDSNHALTNHQSVAQGLTNHNLERDDKSSVPSCMKPVTEVVDYVSKTPKRIQCLLFCIYGVITVLCIVVSNLWESMADGNVFSLGFLGILSAIIIVLVGILCYLPQFVDGDSFRAPLVPTLPLFVAMLNIFLMTSLCLVTWLLFGLWMSVGLAVYLLYGVGHSQAPTTTTAPRTYTTTLPSTHISMVHGDETDDDDDDVYEETALLNE